MAATTYHADAEPCYLCHNDVNLNTAASIYAKYNELVFIHNILRKSIAIHELHVDFERYPLHQRIYSELN